MRALVLLVTLASLSAVAQEAPVAPEPVAAPTPPPVMAAPEEAAPAPRQLPAPAPKTVSPPEPVYPQGDPTFAERCFAVPAQVWIPLPTGRYAHVTGPRAQQPLSQLQPHDAVPADAPTTTMDGVPTGGGSSGGGGLGNLGGGKELLILAVVLIAALPVILYIADENAPAAVEQRFFCPSFAVDLVGGIDLRGGYLPMGSVRSTFGIGHFAADFQFDYSPGAVSAFAGHAMVRLLPKRYVAPAVAFGFRSMTMDGVTRQGFEAGIPHRYVFHRDGLREVSLELRPTIMFGLGGLDVGVEGALLIPVLEPLHLRIGGRVQSFGDEVLGGFNTGVTLTL